MSHNALIFKYKIFCSTERKYLETWDKRPPINCPNSLEHKLHLYSTETIDSKFVNSRQNTLIVPMTPVPTPITPAPIPPMFHYSGASFALPSRRLEPRPQPQLPPVIHDYSSLNFSDSESDSNSNEVKEDSKLIDCIICYTKKKRAIIVPCSHNECCAECAWRTYESTGKCPLCRTVITDVL